MPSYKSSYGQPEWVERIVAALCYFSCGLVGLLYILITGRSSQSAFFQFNFLQGILLGIFKILLGFAFGAIASIMGGTAGLFGATGIVMTPLGVVSTVVEVVITIALIYGSIWALLGKQPEMPILSRLVRQQMR